MEPNYGIIVVLIGAVCASGVLGLSYMGAYFLGHSRGRRDAEREMLDGLPGDRVEAIEGAVSTMAQAIERLTDAQRVALLDRVRTSPEPRAPGARIGQHNTPA
jgi:hypothetical protein